MKKFDKHAVVLSAKKFVQLVDNGIIDSDISHVSFLRHILLNSINDFDKLKLIDFVLSKYDLDDIGLSYDPLEPPVKEFTKAITSNGIVFKIDGNILEAHLPFLTTDKFNILILELKKLGFQFRTEGVLKPYWWRTVKDDTFFTTIKTSKVFCEIGYYIDKSQEKSLLERIQESKDIEKNLLKLSADAGAKKIKIEGLNGELYPFQNVSIEYSNYKDAIFIADKMGLGKTIQAIAITQHKNLFPVLVIVPANLRENWVREFNNWLPDRTVHILKTTKKILMADAYIISYGSVIKFGEGLSKVPFKSIILDESHKIKNEKAKRTKAILKYFKKIPHKIIMTGTPLLNGEPKEFEPQLDFLGVLDSHFGGRWNFIHRYCPPTSNGRWTTYGSANEEELQLELRKSCMIRRDKEDVLKELPPKTRQIIWLPLSDSKAYYEVEKDSINWYKKKLADKGDLTESQIEILAAKKKLERNPDAEPMVRISACKQAATEYKLKAACEWIDNTLEQIDKLIVFTYHRDVLDKLMEIYHDKAIYLYGGMTNKITSVIEKFRTDDNIKIFFGSILSTSEGIDGLQGICSHAAFLELGWNPSIHEQGEDRLHRIGQLNNVNIYYLLGSGTIDEYIYDLIIEKKENIDKATNIIRIFDMIKNRM